MPAVLMSSKRILYQLFSFLVLTNSWKVSSALGDCKDLGFTGTQLCGDCDKLQEYVKDEGLAQECKSCCVESGGEGSVQMFEKVTLEVCKHRMREFPQVEGFINNQAAAYEGLKVSYKYGTYPKLVFRGAGKQKEVIRIDSWTTDNIQEYLDAKLAKAVRVEGGVV